MKQKYIDIHSHLNYAAFDKDREEVIARTKKTGVSTIGIGTGYGASKEVLQLAHEHENMYAIVGLHPIYVNPIDTDHEKHPGEDFDYDKFAKIARDPKVVGIGECGLDFFHITSDAHDYKARQITAFKQQISLALEVDKPLMIHCRDAYTETLEILKEAQAESGGKLRANFHFFAGTKEDAKEILDLGFTVSFTGVITFAPQFEELVKFVPLEKMHAETDSPFVAPKPFRGKRNEPTYVIEVVKKIAEIKEKQIDEVADQLAKNAARDFGIEI